MAARSLSQDAALPTQPADRLLERIRERLNYAKQSDVDETGWVDAETSDLPKWWSPDDPAFSALQARAVLPGEDGWAHSPGCNILPRPPSEPLDVTEGPLRTVVREAAQRGCLPDLDARHRPGIVREHSPSDDDAFDPAARACPRCGGLDIFGVDDPAVQAALHRNALIGEHLATLRVLVDDSVVMRGIYVAEAVRALEALHGQGRDQLARDWTDRVRVALLEHLRWQAGLWDDPAADQIGFEDLLALAALRANRDDTQQDVAAVSRALAGLQTLQPEPASR